MKKIIILFSFILVLVSVWYYNQSTVKEVAYSDLQSITPPAIYKKEVKESPNKDIPKQIIVKKDEQSFKEFDRIEKDWLLKVENLLSAKDNDFYLEIRNRNEEEKMQAYKEFHEYLRQKNGDNFSYHISEDQSVREKAINEKYSNMLLKRIGEEKFKTYLKTKDQFNEELQRKLEKGNAIVIEF